MRAWVIKKKLNEVNEIFLDDEEGEKTTDTENEGVIHVYITGIETENNQDTLNNIYKNAQMTHTQF